MSSRTPPYDEFLLLENNETLLLKDLDWLLDQLPDYPKNHTSAISYNSNYRYRMFCPDCRKARLKLVSARGKKPYLQAINNNEHTPGCYHLHPPFNGQQARSIVDDMSEKEREASLTTLINRLLGSVTQAPASNQARKIVAASFALGANTPRAKKGISRIPRKSINRLPSLTENTYCIVYGEALLNEAIEGDHYHIWFDSATHKHLLDIRCSKNVHNHLATATYYEALAKHSCLMAAFCNIEINTSGSYMYRNCYIEHSSKMMIVPTM